MKKDLGTAKSLYQKALDFAPKKNSEALSGNLIGLGISRLRNREYIGAMSNFEAPLNYSKNPVAYAGLSAAYFLLHDDAKSAEFYAKMSFEDLFEPEKIMASFNMRDIALALIDNNASRKAIGYYEKAIELNPDNPLLYLELLGLYVKFDDNDKINSTFKRYSEIANKNKLQII